MKSSWTDGERHQTYVEQPGAGSVRPKRVATPVPAYDDVVEQLPALHWPARPDVERVSRLAWEITWRHLHPGRAGELMSSAFVDAAFNGDVFLWDAAFTARLTTYARRVLEIDTLRGFYELQAPDGWICRTVTTDGAPRWDPHNPSSAGPNVLAWTELLLAERSGDLDRLASVFPALLAYHRWTRRYRTWPDGGYWSSGWGCGMDGLPRLPEGVDPNFEHGWTTWVDATLQALLSARALLRIAAMTGEGDAELADLAEDEQRLTSFVEDRLWDDEVGGYTDRWPGGKSAGVLHVGTYWALLAGVGAGERHERLVGHLTDPARLGRPVPVPALDASHPRYRADGGYWLGGVWTPTTLMVLDGLAATGHRDLAHQLACAHVDEVAATADRTGTLWENYAPEGGGPGSDARPDFCGWSGASAFTVPLEHVFGVLSGPDSVEWDVRLLDEHGVTGLPVGAEATVDLVIAARRSPDETPRLRARADAPVNVTVSWPGGERRISIAEGVCVAEF